MAKTVPRKHHYVPQFYLRSFGNAKGQVRVVEPATGASFTTSTENVFAQRDYYTVSSEIAEEDHELIEGLYGKIETHARPIFNRLLADDFPLDPQARADFAGFMAVQVSRGPEFEQMIRQATAQLGYGVLRAAAEAPPTYWAAKRAEWETNPVGPEPPPPLTEDQRRALRKGTAFDLVPSREHVAEMRFVGHEQLTFVMMSMAWRLVRFERPSLLSCEHPIAYWRRPSRADAIHGIAPLSADEVRFPLSPTRALVLTHKGRGYDLFDRAPEEAIYDGDESAARRLNGGTLTFMPTRRMLMSPDVRHHPLPVVPWQVSAGVVIGEKPLTTSTARGPPCC